MRLDQLKSVYGDALIDDPSKVTNPGAYDWFKTKDGTIFGVRNDHLSTNERRLLDLSFIPYAPKSLNRTKKQLLWARLTFNDTPPENTVQLPQSVNLIYFILKKFSNQHRDLESAIHSFFHNAYLTTIWKSSEEGIIVLKKEQDCSGELINLIMSDFYCDLFMLHVHEIAVSSLSRMYADHFSLLNKAQLLYPDQHDFQLIHLLPLMLLDAAQRQKNFDLTKWMTKFSELPHDLIKSVEIFFYHNFNLSTAANELYIHRNSLQYRLDRFYQITGLDPKKFKDALIISLLLDNQRYEQRIKDQ
ncbi:PucR family transcriptional regulator [Sporolactobacillus nakayamae]|uniref:PucR C-terminal helix-turn-helix domain-containing protein n=1 Tax=Sporolactobacillus nakayamae TaxID=269670 RepID=A0A1I2SSQ1_9BACL|nr:helix-turn-helix domain-containing protein [Sporolactobacillus nakayamae]SFG55583.1 PucR C-terminal helix-turn-helix domain-containing protein [Sporolactobacillus nakayamae]